MTKLTNKKGLDFNPVVSPDGACIAYRGYDDNLDGYQLTNVYVMQADGTGKKSCSYLRLV